jgi:hypothetical protein
MDCPTPYRDDGNVTAAEIATIFGTGANNNDDAYTPSLTNVFVNGPNEAAIAATDPTPFNDDPFVTVNAGAPNRLTAVTYVGAVRDASDTWYQGWTCSASYVSFGTPSAPCTSVPD